MGAKKRSAPTPFLVSPPGPSMTVLTPMLPPLVSIVPPLAVMVIARVRPMLMLSARKVPPSKVSRPLVSPRSRFDVIPRAPPLIVHGVTGVLRKDPPLSDQVLEPVFWKAVKFWYVALDPMSPAL